MITKNNSRGFTLVELLIILSLISILSLLLLPVIVKTTQHSKSIVCKSNLRQLLIATYIHEYGNTGIQLVCPKDKLIYTPFMGKGSFFISDRSFVHNNNKKKNLIKESGELLVVGYHKYYDLLSIYDLGKQ